MEWTTVAGVAVLVALVAWLIMRGRKKDAEVGESPVKPVGGGGVKKFNESVE
jgi:hypothetical protein